MEVKHVQAPFNMYTHELPLVPRISLPQARPVKEGRGWYPQRQSEEALDPVARTVDHSRSRCCTSV